MTLSHVGIIAGKDASGKILVVQTQVLSTSSVFINGKLKIDYAAGCAYLDDTELHLTPIEFKLLSLLSKNVGKVLTHKFITENIWGSSWDNDVGSLRVFMATLRKKLRNLPILRSIFKLMWGLDTV